MTKRYGRNQRRQHRAELAEAQKLNAHLHSTIALLRATGERNADAVRMTAEILGQHFAALPGEVTHLVEQIPESIRLPGYMRFRGYVASDIAPSLQHTLYMLETNSTELRLDELQGVVRVAFRTPAGDFAYAMSLAAWERYPDWALREQVAREIAECIAHQVVKARNVRRGGAA